MGLGRKIVKLGIATKIYDEARKPENQRRMKHAVAEIKARRDRSRRH